MKKTSKKSAKKEEQEDDKGAKIFAYAIIGLVIIIAGIFSIRFFYEPKQKSTSYSYNNFIFSNASGMWVTEIQKSGTSKLYRIPLHYGPLELENIPVDSEVIKYRNVSEIYITFNPKNEPLSYIALSASEISLSLAQVLEILPIAACTSNETDACSSRPVVNCESSGLPAIFLNYGNETRVYVKNNCIFVEGQDKEIIKASERLLYKWFNVMK